MDPFVVLSLEFVGAVTVVVAAIGIISESMVTKSVRSHRKTDRARPDLEEIDDVGQMLAAANARRRARGHSELERAAIERTLRGA